MGNMGKAIHFNNCRRSYQMALAYTLQNEVNMNEELALAFSVWTLSSSSLDTASLGAFSIVTEERKFCIHSSSSADENSDSLAEASTRSSNNPEITGPASEDGHTDLAAQFLQRR